MAGVAALIGDPARASSPTALMPGGAPTATELAGEAAVMEYIAAAGKRS